VRYRVGLELIDALNEPRLDLRVGVFIYHATIMPHFGEKRNSKNSNKINNLRSDNIGALAAPIVCNFLDPPSLFLLAV